MNSVTQDMKYRQSLMTYVDVKVVPRSCSGMRSAKNTDICAWIALQSCRRPVHFFVMSIIAKYSIFKSLSSVGKTDLDLVTFRSWRLNPSMALVV